MSRSRYDNRAKLITKGVRKEVELPPAATRDEAWARVKCELDVENFYQLYYPHLPDILCKALANMYTRATKGEIELPDVYIKKPVKVQWDFEDEINKLKMEGQINNSLKRMEELALSVVDDGHQSQSDIARVE